MNLKELEYIVKIADEHSLTRAAERLGITSSALNQQLSSAGARAGPAPVFPCPQRLAAHPGRGSLSGHRP